MRGIFTVAFVLSFWSATYSSAAEPAASGDAAGVVAQAVKAAGGEAKLLKLLKIKEELVLGADPAGKKSVRTSVLEPPKYWWLGKRERVGQDKEPATFLVWAWTLGAVTDSKSKLAALPETVDEGKPVVGVRVSETITPAMDLYFDKATGRLVRIDWRSDIHRFSDWRVHDGAGYPARCVGYKKASGKPWYYSQIVELERLSELPEGLTRESPQ